MSAGYPLIVFTDLDDSLFQTREKTLARPTAGAMVPAADDRHGAALSFFARDQLALLHLLQDAVLIPVTGRNHQALRRVRQARHLSFNDARITSHGSMIYGDDDKPLPAWHARVSRRAEQLHGAIQEMVTRLPARLGDPECLRVRVIEDAGVAVYVSIKWNDIAHAPTAQALSEAVRAEGLSESWRIHQNGRNVAILPDYASKADAVRYVMDMKRRERPHTTFIGLGDSHSDTEFLRLCDFALIPSNSQIQAGWCPNE